MLDHEIDLGTITRFPIPDRVATDLSQRLQDIAFCQDSTETTERRTLRIDAACRKSCQSAEDSGIGKVIFVLALVYVGIYRILGSLYPPHHDKNLILQQLEDQWIDRQSFRGPLLPGIVEMGVFASHVFRNVSAKLKAPLAFQMQFFCTDICNTGNLCIKGCIDCRKVV